MRSDRGRPIGERVPNGLRGWELRWLLTLMLCDTGRVMAIPEMVGRLERGGLVVAGRASQTVSDALRLEIAKGRVERVSRGRYRFVAMPKSTKSRFRSSARQAAERRAAARRAEPSR